MELIKEIDSKRSIVLCSNCGKSREVDSSNFKNGFGHKCSLATCGESYLKSLFVTNKFDYEYVSINNSLITIKCKICGSEKNTTPSKIKRGIGMTHNGSSCSNYMNEIIDSEINDFTVISVSPNDVYPGVKMVEIKCNKCGRVRIVRDLNLNTYNHTKCTELIDIPKRFYGIWCSIKNRCKSNLYYNKLDYSEFENFIDFYDSQYILYVDASKIHGEKKISIDRINNNIGYNSQNVRWVTMDVQQGNTRRNKIIYAKSPEGFMYKFSNIVIFSKIIGLNRGSVNNAICGSGQLLGWSFNRTNEYDNTEEGVETNCVYRLHESDWVKLPIT